MFFVDKMREKKFDTSKHNGGVQHKSMPFNHIIATCRFDSLGSETSKVQRGSIPDSGRLVVGGASWGGQVL